MEIRVNGGHRSRSDRYPSPQSWRPEDQPAGEPATLTSTQHDDGILKVVADNDAAVAAYQLSVKAGNPLSERKLAQMFGRTSRRWRARITEARQSPRSNSPTADKRSGARGVIYST